MECKHFLPCGLCDIKNLPCKFKNESLLMKTRETSSIIASCNEYSEAIDFLKREVAVTIKEERGKQYYDLAIKALQKERDKYFPGIFNRRKD